MDVFIFFFSGVDFLFLFLLTTVEITGDEKVGIALKTQQLGSCVDWLSLTNDSAVGQIVLIDEAGEVSIIGNFDDGLGTIELMKENLHLWRNYNYIKFLSILNFSTQFLSN